MNNEVKTKFENIIELIRVTMWPLIVIIVLIFFYSDVKNLINKSSKVSVGSFSMEIQREAQDQGSAKLGELIVNLNEKELKLLLSNAQVGIFGLIGRNNENFSLTENTVIWKNLEKSGLVEFNFNINEVENYLLKLGAKKEEWFFTEDGKSSTQIKDQDHRVKTYIYILPVKNVSASDQRQLESYNISLTDKGRKAIDIITNSVIEQLKK